MVLNILGLPVHIKREERTAPPLYPTLPRRGILSGCLPDAGSLHRYIHTDDNTRSGIRLPRHQISHNFFGTSYGSWRWLHTSDTGGQAWGSSSLRVKQ